MVKVSPPCRWAGGVPDPSASPPPRSSWAPCFPTLAPAPATAVTVFAIRFDDLSNPALTVVIGSEVFTLADTVVYDPRLAVVIYDNGARFYLDGPQARNSSLGGSLEITNATFSTLAFEPSGYTPPPYSLYFSVGTTASIACTYGTLVPAPLPLCGLGVALASARRLRRRRRQGSSTLQR